MILIRVVLILLVLRDVTSIPCVSNESKKDLDDSRKSLIGMKSHIEKTIGTLENGFKKQIGVVEKAFNTAVATLQNKLKTAVEVNKNQIGVMKRALNTVGTKILKVDKSLQVLGKDFQKTKWHKYNGHCYYYSQDNDKQDWFTSEACYQPHNVHRNEYITPHTIRNKQVYLCIHKWTVSEKKGREIGGYIVKIDNKEELKSIHDNKASKGVHYWIGLVEIDEGQFRWSFDQTKVTLSNWYPGYGKTNTSYNCVLLHAGSRSDWFDHPCKTKAPYICESNFCF